MARLRLRGLGRRPRVAHLSRGAKSPWRPPSLLRQVLVVRKGVALRAKCTYCPTGANRQPGGGSSRDFLSRSSRPAIHGRSPYGAVSRPSASPAKLASRVGTKGSLRHRGHVEGKPGTGRGSGGSPPCGRHLSPHRDRACAPSRRSTNRTIQGIPLWRLANGVAHRVGSHSALVALSVLVALRVVVALSVVVAPDVAASGRWLGHSDTSVIGRALGAHPRGELVEARVADGNSPVGGMAMDGHS